jgi:uncharacterized membrane protein
MRERMGVALLSLVGVLVSAYLWLFKLGKIGTIACGTGGCETVQLSKWSSFLGVDVALIGMVGYVGLLVLSLAALQPGLLGRRWPSDLLAALSGVGVAFTLYLTYLELFVIHAICRWCVSAAVIIALIFVLALVDRRRLRRPGSADAHA